MIKAVFFDLDHTLYDRNATLERLAPVFVAHFKGCFGDRVVSKGEIADCLIRSDKLNYLGWPAVYAALEGMLPWAPPGYQQYEEFMYGHMGGCAVPWPETHAVLQWCRGRGLRTGMVTNGRGDLQNDKIDTLRIREYFDHILISGVFGAKKPDPAIFLHAAALAGLAPRQIAFVGDNPENDVIAAAAVGMAPIWLDSFSEWPQGIERPEHIAHSLADVPDILVKMI